MNEILPLIVRFLHISGAVLGLGGLIVAAAALPKMPTDEAKDILARQAGKWIGIGLTICVLAGGYNASVQWHAHADEAYRHTLAIKGALGTLVFIFSTFVFHPAKAFRPFAERRSLWCAIVIIAGLLTVALGAKLHTYYQPADPTLDRQ